MNYESMLFAQSVVTKLVILVYHFFWTVKTSQYGIKIDALRRNAGLAMFLGSTELANVMGTNEDMAEQIQTIDITLCQNCALPIIELLDTCTDIKVGE